MQKLAARAACPAPYKEAMEGAVAAAAARGGAAGGNPLSKLFGR
jgi:hypothetical protein